MPLARPIAIGYNYQKQDTPADAPVFRLTTDSGITGDPVTSWVAEIGNVTLGVNDTPSLVAGPGTAQYVEINGSDFLEKSDGVGDLPTGGASITMFAAVSFGAGQWGGFGWGNNTNPGEAFSIIRDGFTQEINIDTFQEQMADGFPVEDDVEVLVVAQIDGGGNASLRIGNWLVAEDEVPMDIVGTRINVMRTFSGLTQTGKIGFIEVYDKTLTTQQIDTRVGELRSHWIGRDTAPTVSSVSITANSSTSVNFGATLDEGISRMHAVVSENEPTEEQIKLGQDANGDTAPSVVWQSQTDGQAFTSSGTGLTPGDTYNLWYYTENPYGVRSTVLSASAVTLPDNDLTPTDINPKTVNFYESQQPNQTIATFTADQPDCVFSKQSGDAAFYVSAAGALSITTAMTAGGKSLSVLADNRGTGGGTFVQPISVTVNQTPSYGTADYTVTNWDTLVTLLNSWGGTVPDGRDVIVEVQGPSTGTKTYGGQLDHQVTIRPAPGNFSMDVDANGTITGDNGCKLTGCFDVRGSRNIRLFRMYIETNGTGPYGDSTPCVFDGNSDSLVVENCWLTCTPYPPTTGQYEGIGPNWPVAPGEGGSVTTNTTYRNNLITYGDTALLTIENRVENLLTEGNLFSWTRNDVYKARGGSYTTNHRKINNWLCLRTVLRNEAHCDHEQFQGGEHFNRTIRGEFHFIPKLEPAGFQHGRQGIFAQIETAGPTAAVDWLLEQNIFSAESQSGFRLASYNPSQPTSGIIFRHNEFVQYEVGDRGDPQQTDGKPAGRQNPHAWGDMGSNPVFEDNLQLDPIGRPNYPAYIGNTDLQMYTGTLSNLFDDYEAYNPGSPNYAGLHSGRPTTNERSLAWLMPPVGSQAHWDHPSPKGPYIRKREIFVEGIHPGNVGWPVDWVWQRELNSDNFVASAATGNYSPTGDAI